MKERKHSEETFARILHVCRHSGYRRMGVQKRIQENENFLMCIENAGEVLQACPWFAEAARSIHAFFQELQNIMDESSTTSHDAADSINSIVKMCGEYGENLRNIQNINRLLLIVIQNVPCIGKKMGYAESWIEDHELFFEDLRQAMEHVFALREPFESVYPWMGREYRAFLLFQNGKENVENEECRP